MFLNMKNLLYNYYYYYYFTSIFVLYALDIDWLTNNFHIFILFQHQNLFTFFSFYFNLMRKVQRFFLCIFVSKKTIILLQIPFSSCFTPSHNTKKKENRWKKNEKNFSILAKRRKNKSFSPNKIIFFFSLFRL